MSDGVGLDGISLASLTRFRLGEELFVKGADSPSFSTRASLERIGSVYSSSSCILAEGVANIRSRPVAYRNTSPLVSIEIHVRPVCKQDNAVVSGPPKGSMQAPSAGVNIRTILLNKSTLLSSGNIGVLYRGRLSLSAYGSTLKKEAREDDGCWSSFASCPEIKSGSKPAGCWPFVFAMSAISLFRCGKSMIRRLRTEVFL